MFFIIIIN